MTPVTRLLRLTKVIGRIGIICFFLSLTFQVGHAASPALSDTLQGQKTALQQALADVFDQRAKNNLAVPTIQYTNQFVPNLSVGARNADEPGMMTATTIIPFTGPEEAGFEVWPRIMVPNGFDPDQPGKLLEVDRTDEFRALIEQQSPEILTQYEFGHEPRTLQITEQVMVTPPQASAAALAAPSATNSEDILMGFTYTGPDSSPVHYAPVFELRVGQTRISLVVGYELGWALGLRLPASVTLSAPTQTSTWQPYSMSARLNGLNWTGAQYQNAGVADENGSEFVARFKASVFADITLGAVTVHIEQVLAAIPPIYRSFQTPFGTNATFPLPRINNIPLGTITVFGFLNIHLGVGFDFRLSSTRITADWQVVSTDNASGHGSITFTKPNGAVSLGSILVNDAPPAYVVVEVHNFHYWFNYFEIPVYLTASVSIDTFLGSISSPMARIRLFSLDLSPIIGSLNMNVGDHVQCTWDFICQPAGPDNIVQLSTLINDFGSAPVPHYFTVDRPTLVWQPLTWAYAYQIQIADNPAFKDASIYDAGSGWQYMTPTLATGRYYWRIRAQRANGSWGTWGKTDNFIVDLD